MLYNIYAKDKPLKAPKRVNQRQRTYAKYKGSFFYLLEHAPETDTIYLDIVDVLCKFYGLKLVYIYIYKLVGMC